MRGIRKLAPVLQGVSLCIRDGEALGLVGESGSGKSMTTRAIMRLLPDDAKMSGSISYRGEEVSAFNKKRLSHYRSHNVGMVFQDPRSHINPMWKLGNFLTEAVVASGQMTKADAERQAVALLGEVGIPDGARRLQQYPHQLSGGLLQRVMIVAALMPSPDFVLADEISTALDVTLQSEVMAILNDLRTSRRLGMLFITHDLDLAAAVTDRLAVMYAGLIVENGPSDEICTSPRHPYTAALLASRPSMIRVKRLRAVPGRPISASEAGDGCVFVSRCPFASEKCAAERPVMKEVTGRYVACHYAADLGAKLQEMILE